MELKTKPTKIAGRIFLIIMTILVIILIILSLTSSANGGAPSFFGKNIYIVKTDAFEIINSGTAVITSREAFADILPGNIVVLKTSEGITSLAEIQSSSLNEGVYSFSAINEIGEDIRVSQGQIIGKAIQYSNFLGILMTFAKSPAGVFVIAIIPCAMILGNELLKNLLYRLRKEEPITPIKKQDEIPTYIPRPKVDKAVSAYKSVQLEIEQEKAKEQIKSIKPNNPDGFTANDGEEEFPFFRAPRRVPPIIPEKKKTERTMPLSQKRLNEVIAETGIKRNSQNSNTTELTTSARTQINNRGSIVETLKQYTPKKNSINTRQNTIQATSRLDELLRDEGDSGYSLDSILTKIDRTKAE